MWLFHAPGHRALARVIDELFPRERTGSIPADYHRPVKRLREVQNDRPERPLGPRFSEAHGQLFQSRAWGEASAPQDDEYIDLMIFLIATELILQANNTVRTQPASRVEHLSIWRSREFDALAFCHSGEEKSQNDREKFEHQVRLQW
jgi:hypothetical protein